MQLMSKLFFTLMVIIFTTLCLNSCSVFGFVIGAHSDSRRPDSTVIPVSQLSNIKPGDAIKIDLQNRKRIDGYYLGYALYSLNSYKKNYDTFLKNISEDKFMPSIGERIIITTANQAMQEGTLLGFDFDKLLIMQKDRSYSGLMLNIIEEISNDKGSIYPIETIKELIYNQKLPLLSEKKIKLKPEVGIQDEYDIRFYSPQEIERIWYFPNKNRKISGLVTGALIDGLAIVVYKIVFPLKFNINMRF